MDLATHSPISSRGCYHYSTMAYGAGRGTRTPKGFQASTVFKTASSSSRITCIYGVGGGIRTLGRHDNRRRLSRALVSTTHPPLHKLRRKIIEPDVASYYLLHGGLPILLHLKFSVRLALRTVVGLPREDIRKMRQEKHSLAEEGLARDVKEASFQFFCFPYI